MEALAISQSMQVPVWIVSAEANTLKFGEDFAAHEDPIVITFHRYLFALGKHYNATKPLLVQTAM